MGHTFYVEVGVPGFIYGALDRGYSCCLSILRNANVACPCRLFIYIYI